MEFIIVIAIILFLTITEWGPWFGRPSTYTVPESVPVVPSTVALEFVAAHNAKKKRQPYNPEHLVIGRKPRPVVVPVVEKKVVVSESKKVKPVVNVAANPRDTSWFICNHKDLPAPSAAEEMIIALLNLYSVRWYREISFYGLQFTTYSYPRYDFYIPKMNMILEYDGQAYHGADDKQAVDRAKDKFCRDNNIGIIRWNRQHYYHLGRHIGELMEEHGIKKKPAKPGNR